MVTRVIGIDPGASGAVAVYEGGKVTSVVSMPVTKVKAGRVEVDAGKLYDVLDDFGDPSCVDLVVMEDVGADPKFGASRAFSMGRNFGAAWAAVEIRGYPRVRVGPKVWKKALLEGTDKSKEASIAFAQRLWPGLNLSPPGARGPSHDWAEAALLAYYGVKHHV